MVAKQLPQHDRMGEEVERVAVGGCQGQLHPIYSLVGKHQPLEFKVGLGSESVKVEEWLKAIKDAMGLFDMFDQDRIRYVNFLLKCDVKVC